MVKLMDPEETVYVIEGGVTNKSFRDIVFAKDPDMKYYYTEAQITWARMEFIHRHLHMTVDHPLEFHTYNN